MSQASAAVAFRSVVHNTFANIQCRRSQIPSDRVVFLKASFSNVVNNMLPQLSFQPFRTT